MVLYWLQCIPQYLKWELPFNAIYSFFSYQKKIKMTTQEIKDERKNTEGSPEVKGKRRSMQLALARKNIQRTVPEASVIITNPTHYAVALKYIEGEDKAPKIIAKGIEHIAKEVRIIAIKNAIPIYEEPQLARAIYHTGKVGTYIKEDLYQAVAVVLAYVVQLKNYQQGVGDMPTKEHAIELPPEYRDF